jgi:hypothetical protein
VITLEVTVPHVLKTLHRVWMPLSADADVNVYDAVVALAPDALPHVVPSGLRSHWYDSAVTMAGTETESVMGAPAMTVPGFVGCCEIDGCVHTESRTAALAAGEPHPLDTLHL